MSDDEDRSNTPTAPGARLVVAVGASAGGLEAIEALLRNVPADSALAFVVITHSPSGRASLLPDLLGRVTTMMVQEVTGPTMVEPNRVYIAPAGGRLAIRQNMLIPDPTG